MAEKKEDEEKEILEEEKLALKRYFDEILNPSLKEKGFTDDQMMIINNQVAWSNIESAKTRSKEEKELKESNKGLVEQHNSGLLLSFEKMIDKFSDSPAEFIQAFRKKEDLQLKADFRISVLVLCALVFLGACGHLDKSQTATLMGGLIGYLLGHSRG